MLPFEIELGPEDDKRLLSLSLPKFNKPIGVMVSGGLDSAALYYILKKINLDYNIQNKIIPIIILREEGSRTHAEKVINYIDNIFNEISEHIIKYDFKNKIQPHLEVVVASHLSLKQFDNLYIGLIETRPEHAIGITVYKPKDYTKVTYPFAYLEKSHIVDLIGKLNQTKLFGLTVSCDKGNDCQQCNGCRERAWGFKSMKYKDYKI